MIKRRLLYVITSGNLGGAQVHLYDLISCLPASYEVHVVMGPKGWLWERLAARGIELHQVEELVQPISVSRDIQALWKIKNIIQSIQPDLIHCHSSKAGFLGRIAAQFSSIPVVFTVHGWAFTEGIPFHKRIMYRLVERVAAHWTDQIICVSDYDREMGVKAIPESSEKMLTIHNGVRLLAPAKAKPTLRTNTAAAVRLVMVARFNQQKDQALLVKAVAQLRLQNVNLLLSFIGDGPRLAAVKNLAQSLGVTDCIQFLGARDDVKSLLGQYDIFVLATKWEGFPISILEAMRQAMPVLASDVGGVSEAVWDRENGYLVPRGNLSVLTARLWELCVNPSLRQAMGAKGRAIYEQKFTLPLMAKKTVHVYEQVLINR